MIKNLFSPKKLPYQVLFLISFSFLLFNVTHLFCTDFNTWLGFTYKFTELLKANNLFPNYYLPYPAVPVLYLSSFFILLKSGISNIPTFSLSNFIFAYKLPFIFLISSFVVYLSFLLYKSGFPSKISFIAGLLLAVNPFIWQSNAADVLLAIFGSLSILSILVYLNLGEKEKKYFFLSAIFSSLAVLSRASGVFLVVVIPLIIIFYKKSDWNYKKIIFKIFLWLIILTLGMLFLWPNLWLKTQRALKAIIVSHSGAINLKKSYLISSKLNFLYKLKTTFFNLPLLELYFILMFFLFFKSNINSFRKNYPFFKKNLFVFLAVIILFYLATFFIKMKVWCLRYFSLSWIFLDIIVAIEIYRQFRYFYKLPKGKKIIFPYVLFLSGLYLFSYYFYFF